MRVASLLLMLALAWPAAGQTRTLTLRTNAPDAQVFVDSVFVGTARESPFEIPSGARAVALRPPGGSWSVRTVQGLIPAGDAPSVELALPYAYRIESHPFDALVVLESPEGVRTRLGTTPLDLSYETPLSGTLVVSKAGHQAVRVEPGTRVWNRTTVALTPVVAAVPEGYAERFSPRRVWLDVGLMGLAAAATAVSVHYKFQANERFDAYSETGDPALRPGIRRLDLRAGVALSVAGASVGLFSLRLALRR